MRWEPIFARESRYKTYGLPLLLILCPLCCCCSPFWLFALVGDGPDTARGEDGPPVKTVPSPDGSLKAVVFTDQGGYPYNKTEVSVLRSIDPSPRDGDQGNAFECSQGRAPLAGPNDGPIVSVSWKGPADLEITYDDRSGVGYLNRSVSVGHHLIIRDRVSVSYKTDEPYPSQKSPFTGTWSGRCSWDGHIAPISFSVAQFGALFNLKIGEILFMVGQAIGDLEDKGHDPAEAPTRLKVEGNRIRGILIANDGMAYSVDVHRSGPTVWVAPAPTYP